MVGQSGTPTPLPSSHLPGAIKLEPYLMHSNKVKAGVALAAWVAGAVLVAWTALVAGTGRTSSSFGGTGNKCRLLDNIHICGTCLICVPKQSALIV